LKATCKSNLEIADMERKNPNLEIIDEISTRTWK
jgi:hypothetical protein